jgi:hypothetical protein
LIESIIALITCVARFAGRKQDHVLLPRGPPTPLGMERVLLESWPGAARRHSLSSVRETKAPGHRTHDEPKYGEEGHDAEVGALTDAKMDDEWFQVAAAV